MDACFRLRGCRRAKSPAVLAGDGDFAPAIFCAAKAAHRKGLRQGFFAQRRRTEKVMARLPCAKAAQRKGGEQRTLSTGTLCAKESHSKAQARWMAHRKGYGKVSLHKGGAQKRLSATTLFTDTSCTKGFDKRACYARTASA